MAQLTAEGNGRLILWGTVGIGKAVILVGNVIAPPLRAYIFLYDTSGDLQPLPQKFIADWAFDLHDKGGCGSFTLALHAKRDDDRAVDANGNPKKNSLPVMPGENWRVDIYFGRSRKSLSPAFRGWIESVPPSESEGEPVVTFTGVGLMGRMKTLLGRETFARPGGADASEVAAWIAANKLTGSERLGDFVQCIERLSPEVKFESLSMYGQDMKQIIDQLADAAEGGVIWGWDFVSSGESRLYFKNRPASVTNENYYLRIGRPGDAVQYFEDESVIDELINAVWVQGGKAKAPNLLYNPSLELPKVGGTIASGNLLSEPSFEAAGTWTYSGGASRKKTVSAQGEYAHTGDWFAEVDNAGEYIEQTKALPSTLAEETTHRLLFYYACEAATGSRSIAVTLECQDAGGTVLSTPINDEVLSVTARSYAEYRKNVTLPANTAKFRVRVAFNAGTGSVTERATMIDDVALYNLADLGQDGWQLLALGSAGYQAEWANEEDAYHGAYCLRVTPSGTDGGGNNVVRLMPDNDHFIQARDHTDYRFVYRARCSSDVTVRAGLELKNKDGKSSFFFADNRTVNTAGGWLAIEEVLSNVDGEKLRPILELRSNEQIDFDALDLRESGLDDSRDFIDGEEQTFYFRADDAVTLPNLSEAAQASITTYGLREKELDLSEVQDSERIKSYVTGYFGRYAIVKRQGSLELNPCDVHLKFVDEDATASVMGLLSLRGTASPVPDQLPAKISYRAGERDKSLISCQCDLTNLRPDPALILADAFGVSGGPVLGVAGTNLAPRPGNSQSGGATPLAGKQETFTIEASDSRLSNGDRTFTVDLASEYRADTVMVGVRGFPVPPSKITGGRDAAGYNRRLIVTLDAPDAFSEGDRVSVFYVPDGGAVYAAIPYAFQAASDGEQTIVLTTILAETLRVFSRGFWLPPSDYAFDAATSTLTIPAAEGQKAGDWTVALACPRDAPVALPFRAEYVIPSAGYQTFGMPSVPVKFGAFYAAWAEVAGFMDPEGSVGTDSDGAAKAMTISDASDRTGDTVVIRGYRL